MGTAGEEPKGLAGIRHWLTGPQQESFDREVEEASVARLAEVVSRWARVAKDVEAGVTPAAPPAEEGAPALHSVI